MSHLLTCETLRVSHDYSSSSRCQQQNVFQVHYKDSGRSLWRSLTPSYAVPLLKEESSQCLVNLPGMQNDKFRYPCGSPSQVSTEWTDSVVSDHPGLLASLPGRRPSTLLKTFVPSSLSFSTPSTKRPCLLTTVLAATACSAVDRRCSFAAFLGITSIVLSRHCC